MPTSQKSSPSPKKEKMVKEGEMKIATKEHIIEEEKSEEKLTPRKPIPHSSFSSGSRFGGGGGEFHSQVGNPKPMRRSAGRKR